LSQPVDAVRWVPRDELHANDYNPNRVAPPELELLARSILEDGWTQPIVARPDGGIVDGFHRWTVAGRADVAALTAGRVPVVYLDRPRADQMLSTIRHNRARGIHGVRPMASIVRELVDEHGLTESELDRRLGMEREEVERLYDQAGMPEKVSRAKEAFSPGWVPVRD
jgi:ParB-like chromosome segregation protein Spo0J